MSQSMLFSIKKNILEASPNAKITDSFIKKIQNNYEEEIITEIDTTSTKKTSTNAQGILNLRKNKQKNNLNFLSHEYTEIIKKTRPQVQDLKLVHELINSSMPVSECYITLLAHNQLRLDDIVIDDDKDDSEYIIPLDTSFDNKNKN